MAKRRPRDLLLPAGLIVGTIGFGRGTVALAQGTIPGLTSTPINFSGHADAFAAGPDGNVWIVDQISNAVGRLAVDGSVYKAFTVPTAASGLNSIAAGADGNLWFTESTVSKVGRVTTAGAITEFALPPNFHFPVYSFVGTSGTIAPGPDGNLWISGIGQMAKATPQGAVTVVTVPPPTGIDRVEIGKCVAGPDGNLWCLSAAQVHGLYDYHVAKLTTAGSVTLYPEAFQEYDIVEAPDGNVWISAGSAPNWSLTRVTPAGVETVYALPTKRESRLAVGADGNIWFTERTTMGNLWQMILSSATDDGHATFNSAPITLGYPEAIIPVVPVVARSSGIRAEESIPVKCVLGFYVLSFAEYGSNLVLLTLFPETCTELVAIPNIDRGAATYSQLNAGCFDWFFSPDPAKDVQMTIALAKFDVVENVNKNPEPSVLASLPWDGCSTTTAINGNAVVVCTITKVPQGKVAYASVSGSFGLGKVIVTCSSATPDLDPLNNFYPLYPLELGLPLNHEPPVDPLTRW